MTELSQYWCCDELDVPVLANITEFGRTPLYYLEQLKQQGVAMACTLSAFRAMSYAAEKTYITARKGSQVDLLDAMQIAILCMVLDYRQLERLIRRIQMIVLFY